MTVLPRPMRIAVFHNLPSGGAKRALMEWTRRLAERHIIDVYTLSTANHRYCDLRPFVHNYHIVEFTPLPLFNSPFGRLNQFQRWRDLIRLQEIYRNLAERIDAAGYDVVFCNACQFTFIPILQIYLQTPSLYYLHEHFPNCVNREIQRPYFKENHVRQILNRFDPLIPLYFQSLFSLQKSAVLNTQQFLANSKFTALQFKKDFNTLAPVVYYGVDTDTFHPFLDSPRDGYILSVGEMSPRKGFDFLVESLAKIPLEKRPVLRMACNNQIAEERNYIEDLAKQRCVTIEVLSDLSCEQLALEYNRVSLCAYTPVQEPFGLVPLEAMACGTPVLGVAEGGVCESVIDGVTGRLTPRNTSEFASSVESMLSDPVELQRMGQNGRKQVQQNWTWEHSTTILENYIKSVSGLKG